MCIFMSKILKIFIFSFILHKIFNIFSFEQFSLEGKSMILKFDQKYDR